MAASEANRSTAAAAAVPVIKAHAQEHGAGQSDPAVGKGGTAVEAHTVEVEEYTGSVAPVCELQRRQHLNNLGILYTVSLQVGKQH